MTLMTGIQSGTVYIIIGAFLFIFGREMYSMWKDQDVIRKAKHKLLLEKIEKGEDIK